VRWIPSKTRQCCHRKFALFCSFTPTSPLFSFNPIKPVQHTCDLQVQAVTRIPLHMQSSSYTHSVFRFGWCVNLADPHTLCSFVFHAAGNIFPERYRFHWHNALSRLIYTAGLAALNPTNRQRREHLGFHIAKALVHSIEYVAHQGLSQLQTNWHNESWI